MTAKSLVNIIGLVILQACVLFCAPVMVSMAVVSVIVKKVGKDQNAIFQKAIVVLRTVPDTASANKVPVTAKLAGKGTCAMKKIVKIPLALIMEHVFKANVIAKLDGKDNIAI